MYKITILSSSIRIGRKSHRVALYFQKYLTENKLASAEILDLAEYDFPLFRERLSENGGSSENELDFAQKIKAADGIIIVTPEYNGGYPASLKNAIDLLTKEWFHKPIAISTVSNGDFGGNQALISTQFSLWKLHAITVPALFPVPNIDNTFDKNGKAINKEKTDKLADVFIKEIIWFIDAFRGKSPQK
jgi:NAD(P)H-dependent FMN reductase